MNKPTSLFIFLLLLFYCGPIAGQQPPPPDNPKTSSSTTDMSTTKLSSTSDTSTTQSSSTAETSATDSSSTTSEPIMPPVIEGAHCLEHACPPEKGGGENATKNECRLLECPLGKEPPKAGEEAKEAKQLFHLEEIRFNLDPRNLTDKPNDVPLAFQFCNPYPDEGEKASKELIAQCFSSKTGFLVCFQSNLDPKRPDKEIARFFALPNKEEGDSEEGENLVAKMCTDKVEENTGEQADPIAAMKKWEQDSNGAFHGFMVTNLGNGNFVLRTSTSDKMFFYYELSKGNCIRLEFYNNATVFTRVMEVEPNGIVVKEVIETLKRGKMNETDVAKLANGLPERALADSAGPALLGLDMMMQMRIRTRLQVKTMQVYDAKKKESVKCVPTASYWSTMVKPKVKTCKMDGTCGEPKAPEWKAAKRGAELPKEWNGRVELREDGTTFVHYMYGEDWLNLTFAVPDESKLEFRNHMSQNKINRNICYGKKEIPCEEKPNAYVVNYNQLDSKCQLSVGRIQYETCLISESTKTNGTVWVVGLKPEGDFATIKIVENNIRMDGVDLSKSGVPTELKEGIVKLLPDCAVQNKPIDEFGEVSGGVSNPYVLQLTMLPASMSKKPRCENTVQIEFTKDYQLLIPISKKEAEVVTP